MEPKHNLHLTTQSCSSQFPSFTSPDTDETANGADIFSTLRNLATANVSNPSSTSQMLFQTQFPPNQAAKWPADSNNWIDQAKLSLLPMYGFLQASGYANANESPQNTNLPLIDRSLQYSAAETARQAVASFNLQPSFVQNSINAQYAPPESNIHPLLAQINTQDSFLHAYSTGIDSSRTSTDPSNRNQMVLTSPSPKCDSQVAKSDSIHMGRNSTHQSVEDLTEFDLQDFEDFFMDKPSTSFEEPQSHESVYSPKDEIGRNSTAQVQTNQLIPFRSEELANADKELDRLVSLVASQNIVPAAAKQNTMNFFDLFDTNVPSTSRSVFIASPADEISSRNISLDAPKFTPPDSPNNIEMVDYGKEPDKQSKPMDMDAILNPNQQRRSDSETRGSQMFDFPATRETFKDSVRRPKVEQTHTFSLIPREQIGVALARKNNESKVPIYKQNQTFPNRGLPSRNNNENTIKAIKDHSRSDDAYNFDDEFDEKPFIVNAQKKELVERELANQQSIKVVEYNIIYNSPFQAKRKYTRRTESTEISNDLIGKQQSSNSALTHHLAEQIQRRRVRGNFIESDIAIDDNAATSEFPIATCILKRSEMSPQKDETNPQPMPLPKLIIRIPRRESKEESTPLEVVEPTSKRKKRKKKDKDMDWTETKECSFVKHKKRKEKKHKKEHKRRKESIESISGIRIDDSFNRKVCVQRSSVDPFDYEAPDLAKLNYFERPTERPRRGTFLLSKEDLFKSDCSLWRIDNQNLLQKYLPIVIDQQGTIGYKNCQTYSGWCEDYVDDYIVIKVENIKQSRSVSVVKPFLPLQDLFPAINSQTADELTAQKNIKARPEEFGWGNSNQELRSHLMTLVNVMLRHSITLDFIQAVRKSNDWNYLCTLTEIELRINKCLEKIRLEHQLWSEPFMDSLKNFPKMFLVSDFDFETDQEQSCQACLIKSFDVRQVIQLFTEEIYDPDTFVPKMVANLDPSFYTIDFYVCRQCAEAAEKYHKICHLRHKIFKACEVKVELTSIEHPDVPTERIIELCSEDIDWVNNLCEEVIDVFK